MSAMCSAILRSRLYKRPYIAAIVALSVSIHVAPGVEAAVANFWLALHAEEPFSLGPAAPTLYALEDSTVEIDVWVRPAANSTLQGFGLNFVAQGLGVVGMPSVEVYNPELLDSTGAPTGVDRHQLTHDSSTGVETKEDSIVPSIGNFQGFSIPDDLPGFAADGGIGPDCADDQCVDDAGGAPAWRIATVSFDVIGDVEDSIDLFLEIGELGVWHAGEPPTDTDALFGVPGENSDDLHAWSVCPTNGDPDNLCDETDQRDAHSGLPDATFFVVSQLPSADFDDDDDVDGIDFLTWQENFGSSTSAGDANNDGEVDDEDLAIWEAQYGIGPPVAGVSSQIPEPTSLVLLLGTLCTLGWRRR